MVPNILPCDWQRLSPAYAALDEYLRWKQSPQGGQFNINPEDGNVIFQLHPITGANLPTTTYRNLLDHLNHVFTKDGTGPSVLEKILDMLSEPPSPELGNLRMVSKSISTAATKAACKTLQIATSITASFDSPGLTRFIPSFVACIQRNPNGPRLPWLMNANYVKELDFYTDPLQAEKAIRLHETFRQQLEANNLTDPSIAMRATMQDGKAIFENPRDVRRQEIWHCVLVFIEHCQNLEVFRFTSTAWQPFELLPVLAFNCPKLKSLQLSFTEPIFQGGLALRRDLRDFRHKAASLIEQSIMTLSSEVNIVVKLAVRRDEYIFPIIVHLAVFTGLVDTLIIDRSLSDEGYSVWDQGWNKDLPLIIDGRSVSLLTKPLIAIRALEMVEVGNKSQYIMAMLDTLGLRELSITTCKHVEFILKPLVRSAIHLTSVSMHFAEDHATYVEQPQRYHHLVVQDYRYALDFVRAGNFTLTNLELWADFADETRNPASSTLLVPELWFAIQAHLATLVRLTVYNGQEDLRVTDIEELGRCSPHLQELRISARMGLPVIDAPPPLTQGLVPSMKRALLAFRTHKTLRVLVILESFSSDINDDQDPNLSKYMIDTNLEAVVNAVANGVPIKLFTYFESPTDLPSTCHFFYNKTPFEPDITWGVYPSLPAPEKENMQDFKGFEFHDKLLGLKGHNFDEQRNRMIEHHLILIKELELWHPETKRGGATFSPEPPKLPSDSSRQVEQPVPPAGFIGDFGNPQELGGDAAARAVNAAAGQPLLRGVGHHLAAQRDNRSINWTKSVNSNTPEYYINREANRTRWHNPNRFVASPREQSFRLSEEDRNYLFGNDNLPPYDPIAMSEIDFNAMTGRDLYNWEDLYTVLDDDSKHKLSVLEQPTTDDNLEEQYLLLQDYAPQVTCWDISNPYNFVSAKHNLCNRQRYFILKECISQSLVIPTPITEAEFWAKEDNTRLVWLHVNSYVNPTIFPDITFAFALQTISDIRRQAADVTNNTLNAQMNRLWRECRRVHIPHAKSIGIMTENPVTEGEFMAITPAQLYDWAIARKLLNPLDDATKAQVLALPGDPAHRIQQAQISLAQDRKAVVLRAAISCGLVSIERATERSVRDMTGQDLYHWAIGRKLVEPQGDRFPLDKDLTPQETANFFNLRSTWVRTKRDDIIERGKAARYIIPEPIAPIAGPAPPPATTGRVQRVGRKNRNVHFASPSPYSSSYDKDTFMPDSPPSQGQEEEEYYDIDELQNSSKEELILKVMALCTGTDLMEELGMQGLLEAVSQYDRDGLISILLDDSGPGIEEFDEEMSFDDEMESS